MKTSRELRAIAREKLQGKWTNAVLLTVIAELIIGVAGSIPCAVLLITGVVQFGIVRYFLALHREGKDDLSIMMDGIKDFAKNFILGLLTSLFIALWSLLLIVPGIIKSYSYAMSMYIRHDHPELEPNDCIKKSMEMMNGHKWELFCLELSFIGWGLLCVLSFGIGFFWLIPYMNAARTAFYEELKPVAVVNGTEPLDVTIETWKPEDPTKDFQ